MRLKKILIGMIVPAVWASVMFSQDLVELAKKEKARRAKIEAKKAVVVTNADLKRVGTRSSVQTTTAGTPADTAASPSASADVSSEIPDNIDQAEAPPELSLEEQWRRADTRARHLDMQLTRLGQEFYSERDRNAKEKIQKRILETEQQLTVALREAENLKAELDKATKK
jgi:hypothetical protein